METNNPEDALNIALELVFKKNIPVVYWNTNLDNIQVIRKIVSTEYFLNEFEYKGILDAICKLSDIRFGLYHFSLDNEDLINTIHKITSKYEIMLIDYEKKDKELIERIEKISNIPVIAVINSIKNG